MGASLALLGAVYPYEVFYQGERIMAYDERTDRRIQRMSVQKVAIEVMPPLPVTSKTELAAAADKWKELFTGLCDWLEQDVEAAGDKAVAITSEPASMDNNNGGAEHLSLDDAIKLADRITEVSAGNDSLKNAIKLQFVRYGIKPGPIVEVVGQLTKPQADELVALINKEV
jgi:hypothetical protein